MSRIATKQKINWEELVKDILSNYELFHQHYYDILGFSGPSLHFHQRALSSCDPEKIELVYAVLT